MFYSTPVIHYADSSVDTVVTGLKSYVQVQPHSRQLVCGASAGGWVINACDSPDEIRWPQMDSPFLIWLDDAGVRYVAEQVSEWLAGRGFRLQPDQLGA